MICITLINEDGTINKKLLINKKAIIFCIEDKKFLDDGSKCTRIELMEGWTLYVSETLDDILKMSC